MKSWGYYSLARVVAELTSLRGNGHSTDGSNVDDVTRLRIVTNALSSSQERKEGEGSKVI